MSNYITIKCKDADSEIDSSLIVKAASPYISNAIKFLIKRPAKEDDSCVFEPWVEFDSLGEEFKVTKCSHDASWDPVNKTITYHALFEGENLDTGPENVVVYLYTQIVRSSGTYGPYQIMTAANTSIYFERTADKIECYYVKDFSDIITEPGSYTILLVKSTTQNCACGLTNGTGTWYYKLESHPGWLGTFNISASSTTTPSTPEYTYTLTVDVVGTLGGSGGLDTWISYTKDGKPTDFVTSSSISPIVMLRTYSTFLPDDKLPSNVWYIKGNSIIAKSSQITWGNILSVGTNKYKCDGYVTMNV